MEIWLNEVCDSKAQIKTLDRKIIFSAICFGQLYTIDINKSITSTFIAQNKYQLVMFGAWHRHLDHAGINTIRKIVKDKLVDGLTIHGNLSLKGLCEDCMFGKHTAHLYHENPTHKTEVLKQVYINI